MIASIASFGKTVSSQFLLLCFAICLVCAVPTLWFVNQQAEEIVLVDFSERLERRRANLEQEYHTGGLPFLQEKIRSRIERGVIDKGILLLVDPAGRKVEGNAAQWPAEVKAQQGWQSVSLQLSVGEPWQPHLVSVTTLPNGYRLLLSGLLDDQEAVRAAIAKATLGAFLLAMVLALLGSLVIRRHLDRMVTVVATAARNIADGNLSQRTPRNYSDDPLDNVSASLNRILRRIEALIEENRTTTDTLAHDLRSPLTRISANLEQALRRSGECSPRGNLLAIEREVELMRRMIEETLEISRAEAGIGRENFVMVDLAEVLNDLYEMYLPLAESEGVVLLLDGAEQLPAMCNRGLVTRAIANLIDNAFKHALDGGQITLACKKRGCEALIIVGDRGSGIPDEVLDESLGKLRRLPLSRAVPGMGLGLPLVAAVARLHNGTLQLRDNQPGLLATLRMPMTISDSPAQPQPATLSIDMALDEFASGDDCERLLRRAEIE